MFQPCESFHNVNTPLYVGCNASYLWTSLFTSVLLIIVVVCVFKLLIQSIIQRTSFYQKVKEMINSPVNHSFCRYFSDSHTCNFITYYMISIAAVYGDALLKILPSLAGSDMNGINIVLRAFVPVFRAASLFVWFLVLEIIHLRYYYFRRNRVNLVTAVVELSERRIVVRSVLLKALVFSLPIFVAEEILTFEYFQSFRESCTKHSLFFFVRFLEFTIVFCMTIPRLSFLFYEKRRQWRSKALMVDSRAIALLSKHLENLEITSKSAEDLLDELSEAKEYCKTCASSNSDICLHSLENILNGRIKISYARFEEQQSIEKNSLAPMLLTNPRDNVSQLKLALLFLLINSMLLSFNYLVLAVTIVMGEDIMQGAFNWMRIICCIVNLVVVPLINLTVLNPELSFGKFHPVLEHEEFEESQRFKAKSNNRIDENPLGLRLIKFQTDSTEISLDQRLSINASNA